MRKALRTQYREAHGPDWFKDPKIKAQYDRELRGQPPKGKAQPRRTSVRTRSGSNAQFDAVVQGVYESLVRKDLELPYNAPFQQDGRRLDSSLRVSERRALLSKAYAIATKQGQRHGWLRPGTQTPTARGAARSAERLAESRGRSDQDFERTIAGVRKSGYYRVVKDRSAPRSSQWVLEPSPSRGRKGYPTKKAAVAAAGRLNKKTTRRAAANPSFKRARAGWCISRGLKAFEDLFDIEWSGSRWEVRVGGDAKRVLASGNSREEVTAWLNQYLESIDETPETTEAYHVAIPLRGGKLVKRARFTGRKTVAQSLQGEYRAHRTPGGWHVLPKPPRRSNPIRVPDGEGGITSMPVDSVFERKAFAERAARQLNNEKLAGRKSRKFVAEPEREALWDAYAEAKRTKNDELYVVLDEIASRLDEGYKVNTLVELKENLLTGLLPEEQAALQSLVEPALGIYWRHVRTQRLKAPSRKSEAERASWVRKLDDERAAAGTTKGSKGGRKSKDKTRMVQPWFKGERLGEVEEVRSLQGTSRFMAYFQNRVIQMPNGRAKKLSRSQARTDLRVAWIPNKELTEKLALTRAFWETALEVLFEHLMELADKAETLGGEDEGIRELLAQLKGQGAPLFKARALLQKTSKSKSLIGEQLHNAADSYISAALAVKDAEAGREKARDAAKKAGATDKAAKKAAREAGVSMDRAVQPFLTAEQAQDAKRRQGRRLYQVYSTLNPTLFEHVRARWEAPSPEADEAARLKQELDNIEKQLQRAGLEEAKLAVLFQQSEIKALKTGEARDPDVRKLIRKHYATVEALSSSMLKVQQELAGKRPTKKPAYPMSPMPGICSSAGADIYKTRFWEKFGGGFQARKVSAGEARAEKERIAARFKVDPKKFERGGAGVRLTRSGDEVSDRAERAARTVALRRAAQALVDGLDISLTDRQVKQSLGQALKRAERGVGLTERQAVAVARHVLATDPRKLSEAAQRAVLQLASGHQLSGVSAASVRRLKALYVGRGGQLQQVEATASGIRTEAGTATVAPGAAAPKKAPRSATRSEKAEALKRLKASFRETHGSDWYNNPEIKASFDFAKAYLQNPMAHVEQVLEEAYGKAWRKNAEAKAIWEKERAKRPDLARKATSQAKKAQEQQQAWNSTVAGLARTLEKRYGKAWRKNAEAQREFALAKARYGGSPNEQWAEAVLEKAVASIATGRAVTATEKRVKESTTALRRAMRPGPSAEEIKKYTQQAKSSESAKKARRTVTVPKVDQYAREITGALKQHYKDRPADLEKALETAEEYREKVETALESTPSEQLKAAKKKAGRRAKPVPLAPITAYQRFHRYITEGVGTEELEALLAGVQAKLKAETAAKNPRGSRRSSRRARRSYRS